MYKTICFYFSEDDASKKKLSENTNVPKFTAPSLEDIRTRGELFPEVVMFTFPHPSMITVLSM